MTSLALGSETSLVLVVLLVTVVAQFWRIFEFVIRMTFFALGVLVLTVQFKMRFTVVEVGCLPVFFFVAILTLGAQPAFVFVSFFMAAIALGRCVAVFLGRQMTILAKHFAVQVPALQYIAGLRVVKVNGIQLCYARITSLVVGVTLFTWLLFLH